MTEIDNINFCELESEKYWSFAKSYKGDPKAETRNMIFGGEYLGARKIDGAYYRFIKDMDGNIRLQGRSRSVSGEFLDKINHVPHLIDFFNSLPNGTCLLGELYFPGNEGSNKVTTIMGCLTEKAIERQKSIKLHYYIFDIWAYDGKSFLNTCMKDRVEKLREIMKIYKNEYIDWANYLEGPELWIELQNLLSENFEGIVITKKTSHPEPGKRTARKTLKVKKELQDNIDCFFTGRGSAPTRTYNGKEIENWKFWVNDKTDERLPIGEHYNEYVKGDYAVITPVTKPYYYKWASSLEIGVLDENKIFSLGWISGLTDEIKANFKDYKYRCIEVSAMQWTDETMTALRHGKFIQFRDDLTPQDCTIQKIRGM